MPILHIAEKLHSTQGLYDPSSNKLKLHEPDLMTTFDILSLRQPFL